MVRQVALYSPMFVLFAWAVVIPLGLESHGVTAGGRVLLGLTLACHIRQEIRDRRR